MKKQESFSERIQRIRQTAYNEKTGNYSAFELYNRGKDDDLKWLIELVTPRENVWDAKFLTPPEAKKVMRKVKWETWKPLIFYLCGLMSAAFTWAMMEIAAK